MGETIEQLDSELAINSEELQRIQHYKVRNLLPHCYMYVHVYVYGIARSIFSHRMW